MFALALALSVALLPAHGGEAAARGNARGVRHSPVTCSASPTVFLTREVGKNGKLETLLVARGVPCVELPCIAFEKLPGADELPALLAGGGLRWVVVTSPEAASVLAEAWAAAGKPEVRVASVGAATAKALGSFGITSAFMPSKATGKVLAAELPREGGELASVLYPCSALAADTVAESLAARGFAVRRLETYTTVAATWAPEQEAMARAAEVVSFGSPSAAVSWPTSGINNTSLWYRPPCLSFGLPLAAVSWPTSGINNTSLWYRPPPCLSFNPPSAAMSGPYPATSPAA